MAKIGERIVDRSLGILAANPEGVRYSELVRQIAASDASLKINTIHGNVWNLDEQYPDRIYKPSRGLFRLTKYRDPEWLVNEVEECTKAIALGGNRFRDKWALPTSSARESRSEAISSKLQSKSCPRRSSQMHLNWSPRSVRLALIVFSVTRRILLCPKRRPTTKSLDLTPFAKCSGLAWFSLIQRIPKTLSSRSALDRDTGNRICSMRIAT